MKIFVRILSIFSFILSLSSTAQVATRYPQPIRELNDIDFQQAKSLFLKMVESPNWKKADSISTVLAKSYGKTEPPEFENQTLYLPWIEKNLHLTKFASVGQAIFLETEWKKAEVEINTENSPLYELLNRASPKQIDIIIQPILGLKNIVD